MEIVLGITVARLARSISGRRPRPIHGLRPPPRFADRISPAILALNAAPDSRKLKDANHPHGDSVHLTCVMSPSARANFIMRERR